MRLATAHRTRGRTGRGKPRPHDRSFARGTLPDLGRGITALLVLASIVLIAAPAAGEPRRGDLIAFSGRVVDSEGVPLSGLAVVLEASRTHFSLRKLGQREGPVLRQPARVGADGRFRVEWQWDGHHNTFTLAAGHEVELGGRPDFEILARRDVTPLVNQGGGELELTVEKAGYARWLGSYLDGRASDDEVRLFQDMGRPDRISFDPREPGESAWWYFSIGKVYRFADGALDQVTHFEPVEPPPSDPR